MKNIDKYVLYVKYQLNDTLLLHYNNLVCESSTIVNCNSVM